MTPDDFELMAFVDGELDAQTSKRVAEAVEADPALRAKVDALIESRDVARAAYAPAEDAPQPRTGPSRGRAPAEDAPQLTTRPS